MQSAPSVTRQNLAECLSQVWGTGGREFKSPRSDQLNQRLTVIGAAQRYRLGSSWAATRSMKAAGACRGVTGSIKPADLFVIMDGSLDSSM